MTAARRVTDQADMLRQLAGSVKRRGNEEPLLARAGLRMISITSGRGGVGKSSVVINLAETLARLGQRVLVVDADHGTPGICRQLGVHPPCTLGQVLSGDRSLEEIVVDAGNGVEILPAGLALQQYQALSPSERLSLLQGMGRLEERFDYILIDTGSGIPANVTGFAAKAREVMLVVTPEATSITDAYALVKTLSGRDGSLRFRLLVNRCRDAEEGAKLFAKLTAITGRFLEVSLDYSGYILNDEMFLDSVRRSGVLCRLHPEAQAARGFRALAQSMMTEGGSVPHSMALDQHAVQRENWRKYELSS